MRVEDTIIFHGTKAEQAKNENQRFSTSNQQAAKPTSNKIQDFINKQQSSPPLQVEKHAAFLPQQSLLTNPTYKIHETSKISKPNHNQPNPPNPLPNIPIRPNLPQNPSSNRLPNRPPNNLHPNNPRQNLQHKNPSIIRNTLPNVPLRPTPPRRNKRILPRPNLVGHTNDLHSLPSPRFHSPLNNPRPT